MAKKILEVSDLVTRFHTDDGIVKAVNGISYTLDEGETVGVVGESGCGKSVHALSIMRLIPVPPGEIAGGIVKYMEKDLLRLSDTEMRKVRGGEIAMIFQDPMTSLNPVMTIGRQIMEVLHLHVGLDGAEAHEKAGEMLALVGIPEATKRLDSYPHEFSGGMRQRAMIAMALAGNPHILIADEPTTALDVTIQAQIIDLVRRLRDKIGMAIIWITHDLGIMAGLAERLMVMYAGFFVEKAPVKVLYGDPRHPYTSGLLKSLPRMDQRRGGTRLIPIFGRPPDLVSLPKGCPFLPRCRYSIEQCAHENPQLVEIEPDHEIACWVDVRTAETHEVDA
ncbi:MAG: ABC transporter ATP-binding protein [Anaerolineales bacterium]